MNTPIEETKSVGGKIPEDLFWKFKETYTRRRETATEALINAIQLYNDALDENNSREEVK
jgi:hypothetical protein